MKIKIILLLFIKTILYSQAEYQVLTTSHNIFQLSSNGASIALNNPNNTMNPSTANINDNKYGFSIISYPSDIKFYNFKLRNYS